MQAAQNTPEIPLITGEIADRVVDAVYAGVKNRVEIESGPDNDPEKVQAHGTEMAQRVVVPSKIHIEKLFGALEESLRSIAQGSMKTHVKVLRTAEASIKISR